MSNSKTKNVSLAASKPALTRVHRAERPEWEAYYGRKLGLNHAVWDFSGTAPNGFTQQKADTEETPLERIWRLAEEPEYVKHMQRLDPYTGNERETPPASGDGSLHAGTAALARANRECVRQYEVLAADQDED